MMAASGMVAFANAAEVEPGAVDKAHAFVIVVVSPLVCCKSPASR